MPSLFEDLLSLKPQSIEMNTMSNLDPLSLGSMGGSSAPSGGLGGFGFSLPKINIDIPSSTQQPAKTQETQKTSEEAPQQQQSGEALNIEFPKIDLPDFSLPVPDLSQMMPDVDFSGIQLPNVSAQSVEFPSVDIPSMQLPSVDAPNISAPNIDTTPIQEAVQPVINTAGEAIQSAGDTISGAASTVEQTVNPVIQSAGETITGAYETVASPVEQTLAAGASTAEQIMSPAIQETAKAADTFLQAAGAAAAPVADFVAQASEPVRQVINEYTGKAAEWLGDTTEAITADSSIIKSDGSGYGHIELGDSGYSIDISTKLDNIVADVTAGTVMDGVSGNDIYSLTTNPTEFVQNKSSEAAQIMLADNFGMDKGMAGDVVAAISNPEQFVADKGKTGAIDFIAGNTGLDSGLVGAGLDILSSKDIGEAAQKVAETAMKSVATETTLNVVSAIPVAGPIIATIARIFRYSCYLSTGSYFCGYLTKRQYLEFTNYRIKYQSKERFASQVWIGYQIAFMPVMHKMLRDKKFANSVHDLLVLPWYRYIRHKTHGEKLTIGNYFKAQSIRVISLMAYYALLPKSLTMKASLQGVNVLQRYKDTISFVERVNHARYQTASC